MEEQKLKNNSYPDQYLNQAIKFRATQNDKLAYKLQRKRILSEFNSKQRTLSPHSQNIKQKHAAYKKDLLMEKFQNLNINNGNKPQKIRMKLKLEKHNKQNQQVIGEQLNRIQNVLQMRLQAQNSILRKSLSKMQGILEKSLKKSQNQQSKRNFLRIRNQIQNCQDMKLEQQEENRQYQKRPNQKISHQNHKRSTQKNEARRSLNNNQPKQSIDFQKLYMSLKQQLLVNQQKQKQLQVQNTKMKQQKNLLQEQVKKFKSINSYLSGQNYKLSLQTSFLKEKIIDMERNQYLDVLKQMEGSQNQGQQSQMEKINTQNVVEKTQENLSSSKKTQSNSKKQLKTLKSVCKTRKLLENVPVLSQQNSQPMPQQGSNKQNLVRNSQKRKTQNDYLIQKSQTQVLKQNYLIKQLDVQSFSLKGQTVQQQSNLQQKQLFKNFQKITFNNQQKNLIQTCLKYKDQKIKQISALLNEEKALNQQLCNQIANLRLRLFSNDRNEYSGQTIQKSYNSSNQSNKNKVESAISIQLQSSPHNVPDSYQIQKKNERDVKVTSCGKNTQNKLSQQSKCESVPDQVKQSKPSIQNFSCKGTKSKILSNQFIYFAQNISQIKQIIHQMSGKKNEVNQKNKTTPLQKLKSLEKSKLAQLQEKQDQKNKRKRTECMQKIQIPMDQVSKRRKSFSNMVTSNVSKISQPIKNKITFYTNHKINQLQVLRETLSLKFQAFKYTYQLFQNQMMLWPTPKAKITDLKSILQEYPFFLDQNSISVLLSHCNIGQSKQVKIDIFCSKLKQFIKEYQQMSDQEQLILQKKIYKRWKYIKQEVMEHLKKNQTSLGQISKQKFNSVFQEFKFQSKQIHHLLCQNVAVSSDINHIKYAEYFQNFFTKQ